MVKELFNLDVEKIVLATLLQESYGALPSWGETPLHPLHFYSSRHGQIFAAMNRLSETHRPIDIHTVSEALADDGNDPLNTDEKIWLHAEWTLLSNLPEYTGIIYKLAWLRRTSDFAAKFVKQSHNGKTPDELYRWAFDEIQGMAPQTSRLSILPGADVGKFTMEIINDNMNRRADGMTERFDWPWKSWNSRILPLYDTLALLAASNGTGKSTYLDIIAEHWARKGGKVVLAHLEDTPQRKVLRRATRYCGISFGDYRRGSITSEQYRATADMVHRIDTTWGRNLDYMHCGGYTVDQLIAGFRSRIMADRCDIILIDYLNMIAPTAMHARMYDKKYDRMTETVAAIKVFSEQYGIPVMMAAQMTKEGSRSTETDDTGIRGSYEIADKVQLIVMLKREKANAPIKDRAGNVIANPGDKSPIVDVNIEKQNDGFTGKFQQFFDGSRLRVDDLN